MHKFAAWIISDAAAAQSQRDFPNSPQRHPGNLHIDGLPRHVITMACRASPHPDELFVIFLRPVGGHDMNIPPAADALLHESHEFDELHVHRCRFIGMVAPEKIIELIKRGLIVCATFGSECDRQTFLGLQIK